MTIYILEQDPTIYITPTYYGNKFVYRMAYIRESNYRTLIRYIDLRRDKLRVHGTDIKENMFQRLHDSLTLGQKQGDIYVNCHGACYILVTGKGLCKPIYNVVFDWSPFGVVVPGSINNSLKKELNKKDKEIDNLNRQLLSTMEGLKEATSEANKLREEGLANAKTLKEKELELKTVIGKLSSVDFELESNKIELDSSKKAVLELQDQLSTCQVKCHGMKTELQIVNDQLILAIANLGVSNEKVNELEEKLSSSNEELEDTKTDLENMQYELSSTKIDLQSTKFELESSKINVIELENQLSSSMKYNENFIIEIKNLKEEISSINKELESSKLLLNRYEKEVQEIKNRPCVCKEEHHHISDKFRDISNDLISINSEVKSSNRKIEEVLISMLWNEMGSEDETENIGYDMLRNNRNVSDTTNKSPVHIKIEEIDD